MQHRSQKFKAQFEELALPPPYWVSH